MLKQDKVELKDTVKNRLLSTGRDGIQNLVKWLEEETDYFTAPSSTKYHGSCEGGLLNHSFTVLMRLLELTNQFGYITKYNYDSLVVCALLHDLCKVNFYKKGTKNVKNPDTGKWETVETYIIDEQFKYGGHGSKSVYLAMRFIQLEDFEASAINCHMGAWDLSTYNNPSGVYESNPLAWLLHVADEAATYIDKQ